ncbi:unnamed protein product [Rhodiola kirilowii]
MFSQTCELLRKYLKERGPLVPDASSTTINNTSSEKQQMTIFYGGRVIVLENVSYHKANEVMRMAATNHTDHVSQMRTRSLTRFFEKRKDRIRATAPYALSHIQNKSDDKSWLGLAPVIDD